MNKKTKVETLKNKLRVVRVPMEGARSVTVLAMVGIGSRYESEKQNGISHFLEHMVFKGSKKWPTAMDLSQVVDGIGADFNAFTGKEYTGFYVKSASMHMELSLDVLSDMLYTSKLRQSDIDRERGVIAEEINMYNDLPQHKVEHLYERAMYGDVGLGRRIDGEHHTVAHFTKADFSKHLQTWYGLDNTCVVVAGDASVVDKPGTLKLIEDYFDKGKVLGDTTEEKKLGYEEHGEVQVNVDCKQCDQAHFLLGFPAYSLHHENRYALSLLQTIMGGNMSSRLFTEVREKRGLAYYSRLDVDRYADTGSMAAVEGVDVKRLDEAVKVTMGVFADVVADGKNGISDAELNRAKEYLAGSLLLSMEGSRNVAQYWGQRVTLGDEIVGAEEVIGKLREIGREEVVSVAKELINPEKMVFALVGPFEDDGRFDRLLKFE